MIWHYPDVPSLLVTYDVATDFFFSGHTALAVLGAVEVVRFCGMRWWLLGAVIAVFESVTVLVLRAHYTMDVFTGAVVALYASVLAQRWAPGCDRLLARMWGNVQATTEADRITSDESQLVAETAIRADGSRRFRALRQPGHGPDNPPAPP
jgi:hypothetical protein